jgi:putative ABC transport system permease protein
MFRNYFKTAFRNLARNKVYSFINIAGLSMGLACAMLIMLYIKDEVSFDRFHKNATTFTVLRKKQNMDKMVPQVFYKGQDLLKMYPA